MDEQNWKAQMDAVHDVLDTKVNEKPFEDLKHCVASLTKGVVKFAQVVGVFPGPRFDDAEGVDHRVQALPFVLPSLMLQLIEPSVDSTVRDETLNTIVPPLVDFVAYAANNSPGEEDGGAAHAASLLISRSLGTDEDVQVIELWRDGDFGSILELVEVWKSKQ